MPRPMENTVVTPQTSNKKALLS